MGHNFFELDNDVFEDKTNLFGKANVINIDISRQTLNRAIAEIVLNIDNLEYLFFAKKHFFVSKDTKISMYNRFLPSTNEPNIAQYVSNHSSKGNFYSFLAEALLTIILRDLFEFNLCACVIDTTDTIFDGHTGIDSCYCDYHNKKIVLGESKFYKSLQQALDQIRDDFTVNNSIANKLDSLLRTASSNRKARKIMIQEAGVKEYKLLHLEEFLELDLVFTGFVLHEGDHDITAKKLKTDCGFTSPDIEKHISSISGISGLNYSLIVLHLPIESKQDLITLIIEEASRRKESL